MGMERGERKRGKERGERREGERKRGKERGREGEGEREVEIDGQIDSRLV